MEADFLALMPSTVTVAPFTGQSGSTAPTFGSPVTFQCRIEMQAEYVRSHDGREAMARGRIFLATAVTTITVRDRVTLPSGYGPTQPPILDVNAVDDEAGSSYVVLVIG